jgi:hypothetical protein
MTGIDQSAEGRAERVLRRPCYIDDRTFEAGYHVRPSALFQNSGRGVRAITAALASEVRGRVR